MNTEIWSNIYENWNSIFTLYLLSNNIYFVRICRGFYSRELFPLLNNLSSVEVKEIADMLIKHLLLNILFVPYRQIQNISPLKDNLKTSEKCP